MHRVFCDLHQRQHLDSSGVEQGRHKLLHFDRLPFQLRSFDVSTYEVLRTSTSQSNQSFTVARPRLWNKLPLRLRDSSLLSPGVPLVAEQRTCFAEDRGAQ